MTKRTLIALCALAFLGTAEARAASSFRNDRAKKSFIDLVVLRADTVKSERFANRVAATSSATSATSVAAIREARIARPVIRPNRFLAAQNRYEILNARMIRLFDIRLNRFIRRFGTSRTPPASDFLPGRTIAFRQQFIYERFTPGATVAGIFFTTSATPSIPGSIDVFNYFPVYQFNG